MLYSVYAHLARASLAVRAGDTVARGALLGRVGRTGRASGNHLHFEIRRAPNPAIPWQFATVLDPLTWIRERRATPVETGWPEGLLGWARLAGIVPEDVEGDASLSRALWWRMLTVAARIPTWRLPEDPARLREALVASGVLPGERPRAAHGTVRKEWQAAFDKLARSSSPRVPPPADAGLEPSPAPSKQPTIAETCLAIALLRSPAAR